MSDYDVFRVDPKQYEEPKPRRRYPFPEMQVGDAFKLADDDNHESVRISALRYSHRTGRKIVTRSTDDGVICVRTA